MAKSLNLTIALCLFAVTYVSMVSVSEAAPLMSINDHLLKNCLGYFAEMREEGTTVCDSEIIDQVHDHAEELNFPGYDGDLVEDFLDLANDGGLCYLEGSTINVVKGDCAAMGLVCQAFEPKVVDRCGPLRKQASAITPSPVTEAPMTQPATVNI
eukprot:XP_011672093.1 PREDICTED: uncharacterized protein LOC105442042 [Strongylocentrotus purpuratus]